MSSYGKDKLVDMNGDQRRIYYFDRKCSEGCEWYKPGSWWPRKLWMKFGLTVRAIWLRGHCGLWKKKLKYADESTSINGELYHSRNDVRCDECIEARNVEQP